MTSWVFTGLIAYDCYGYPNDTWIRPVGRSQLLANYNPSLGTYVMALRTFPPNPFGTPVETAAWAAGFAPDQAWNFNAMAWKAIGDLCVAARSVASGSQLEVQACTGSDNQKWDFEPSGRIRLSGQIYCANVSGASTATGTPIVLYSCGSPPYPNEVFSFTDAGEIAWGGKCFNVSGGYPIPGSPMVLYDCGLVDSPYQNEQFHLTGQITSGGGQCLDMTGGVSFNGVAIEVYPCVAGARNEVWDYYFLVRPAPPGR
ncbi:ricin-type beta-trefoil lectin domain protein [Candidatus Acetothermia bacterium]|nr:ricin-type beta-trefoil lectin domain protein [Candidatus Acetothermia bacterium]